MSAGIDVTGLHLVGFNELKRNWGWFLALGICLILLGTVALGSSVFFTLASVVLFGWLLLVGGILEAVHAFWRKQWSGFFIDLLTGILYVVVGFMVVANPGATAITLTLLIALFLMFGGVFRIVTAIILTYHHRAWLLLHGVINLLLGIAIWHQWPLSGLWVIGLFIGIDMIFNGWSLVMLALTARKVPVVA
jgi:uncharacterized membrane protein HdeD (DUF308 family)